MELKRLQDNLPEIYSYASRDFQLMERLYDTLLNGTRYDIYSMLGIIDTQHCRSNLLPLLRIAVGFISTAKYPDRVLRTLLAAFPVLIKSKGQLQCIRLAVQIYLKAFGGSGDVETKYAQDTGTLNIIILSSPVEVNALSSWVKFFAPTGLKFSYTFSQKIRADDMKITQKTDGTAAVIGNSYNGGIRTEAPVVPNQWIDSDGNKHNTHRYMDKYIAAVGSAVVASGYNDTYTETSIKEE